MRPSFLSPLCPQLTRSECCGGGGSSPSQAATKPHGYGKRAVFPDAQAALFPQTHLDRTFCPKNLHACTVYTPHGGEWSYECVDFETELEACGGCANGGGADCTAIDNAMSVGCTRGVCEGESGVCRVGQVLTSQSTPARLASTPTGPNAWLSKSAPLSALNGQYCIRPDLPTAVVIHLLCSYPLHRKDSTDTLCIAAVLSLCVTGFLVGTVVGPSKIA